MTTTRSLPDRFILAGEPQSTGKTIPVHDKFTGEVMAEIPLAGPSEIERAIALGKQAERACARISPDRRAEILDAMAKAVQSRADELTLVLAREAGKPIQAAKV
ncbi:MAG: aldehyde dehydrogenase family protein, partial [bacterium]|nr:aldehyde dehydrogenase family protein [bacterium]